MRQDFKSLTEVLAYTETRIILNVDRYSRFLLGMGDIFTEDRPGVYDSATGDCILNFDKGGGYWKDKKGRIHDILSIEDYDRALGDIYSSDGRLVMSARHHRTTRTDRERSLPAKARDAAAAYVHYMLSEYHDNIILGNNIPSFEDHVFLDLIMEFPKKLAALRQLEKLIWDDFIEVVNKYNWHEIWIQKTSNMYLFDVKADIRIRKWYEDKFHKEMSEDARRWETGDEQDIICT